MASGWRSRWMGYSMSACSTRPVSRRRRRCSAGLPRATCEASFGAANAWSCFSTSPACSLPMSASCSSDQRRRRRGMPDAAVNDVRGRYAALSARLDGADASEDRSALKAEIIELFRTVERELAELGALKEDVKKLVERWKAIGGTPQPTALQPVAPPLRADHIGASTFIEKGWSR